MPVKTAEAADSGLTTLAGRIGHDFRNYNWLAEALTHRSAASGDTYRYGFERLEFLGDRVLGLVIADLLLEAYPEDPEGALARRFTALVRREALAEVAKAVNLGEFLYLAANEERSGGRQNTGIQADACEALIAALYLDGGLEAARSFIVRYWRPLLVRSDRSHRDAKTRLQEWAQARGMALPDYRVIAREGPAHDPLFSVAVTLADGREAEARAASKRKAEQAAAIKLLEEIETEGRGP